MTDWRPIETAPLDGTEVDLWLVNENGKGWRQPDAYYVRRREEEFSDFNTGEHRYVRVRRDGWWAPYQNYEEDGFCDQPERNYGRPPVPTFIRPTHWMPQPDPPATS